MTVDSHTHTSPQDGLIANIFTMSYDHCKLMSVACVFGGGGGFDLDNRSPFLPDCRGAPLGMILQSSENSWQTPEGSPPL